ncbi:hypothetical protein [Phaeobacter sp. J2-8]|uniref:hypothetical protein n=1 Tax=Phaeobacter sp. J2-8 TaxID=2931394 RepID=UPI001FD3A320|nr:hypothetical protein [Phaeobacter sp. J2-8]MCJ7874819.1 hypothetical protein [Phaeobacter sp. J2-8]
MSDAPQLILHVGAPKCGSSALQTALSMTPDLVDETGRKLRYTSWRQLAASGLAVYGRDLTMMAQSSAYGYVSWPNVHPDDTGSPVFPALNRVRRTGLRKGHVPIVSSEGWINRAALFAPHLERWGHPPVEVVAFLRPVVDWYNSAFWQWGIWQVPSLDAWIRRSNMSYRFGMDLEAWAHIPNVRVRFAWAKPDTVAQFSSWQGADLPPALTSNVSSSPPLIGLLMRRRRLRPSGHDAATEFVVQRWCPPVAGRRLWAVMARHVHQLRPVVQENLSALRRIASDDAMRAVCEDPRWFDEQRYHAEINAGVSPLNDRGQLAALHGSLAVGLQRLAEVAGTKPPDVPICPSEAADLDEWDAVLLAMLEALLKADRTYREAARSGIGGLWLRLGDRLLRAQDHWFSKSR